MTHTKSMASLAIVVLVAAWLALAPSNDARSVSALEQPAPREPARITATSASLPVHVTALSSDVRALDFSTDVFAADPEAKKAKKIAKLEKKFAKTQGKLAKLEAKADLLSAQIDDFAAQLEAALLLPEEDPKDAAAKAKLIKKLQKKLAGLGKKTDKLVAKQVKTTDKIGDVSDAIEDLDPGNSSGSVAGMLVAEQMSVVTPDAGPLAAFLAPAFSPESDYEQDPLSSHVWDQAMEPIDSVNALLCYIAATGYADMVNRGDYVAQVDESRCESGNDNSSSSSAQGQSSAPITEAPSLWTVSSARGSDASLQLVKMWVPNNDDHGDTGPDGGPQDFDEEAHIRAKIVVHEERTEANPFGSFAMNWANFGGNGKPSDGDGFGNLTTLDTDDDSLGFTLFEGRGDVDQPVQAGKDASRVRVSVRMSPEQTEGFARIRVEQRYGEDLGAGGESGPLDTGILSHDFLIAFNETHMLRRDEFGDVCFDRASFHENIWRYGLYHATGEDAGQRVERNGGFGFETDEGSYGWASYWGVWAPDDLETGDVVTKQVFGEDSDEDFGVFVAPGRLIRNVREELSLAAIDGMEFEWFEDSFEPQTAPTHWRLRYDFDSDEWLMVATFDEQTGTWDEFPGEQVEALDLQQIGWLGLWSDALGGSVFIEHGNANFTVWSEEFVDGDDPQLANGDLSLYGFFDVLAADIDQSDANIGDVFLPAPLSVESPHTLRFDAETLTLLISNQQGEAQVGLADGVVPEGGPFEWGMRTGPLVPDVSGFSSMDEIWQAEEFYTYETGANPWNKFTALVDGEGAFVSFDPPLEFAYQHSSDDDANGSSVADGQTFLLTFHGHGDLSGIPHDPVDLDGDDFPDRWYPRINIADGTLVGPTGTEYVVRALDKELTLQEDELGCEGLTLTAAEALELPEESVYTLPDIGPEPTVEAPPAVIDGIVQEVPSELP